MTEFLTGPGWFGFKVITPKAPRLVGIRRLLHDERAARGRAWMTELLRAHERINEFSATGYGNAEPARVELPAELLEPCPDNVRARKIGGRWIDERPWPAPEDR